MKSYFIFIFYLLFSSTLFCQTIFEENFEYTAGDTLSNNGWAQIRNGNPITVQQPGLEYSGYSLSGIGNAALINSAGGQEVKKTFASISADSLYLSFLINISQASTTTSGGLFLYLTPANGNIFSRRFTVFTKMNQDSNIAFGITKGGGIRYTGYNYQLNTTYLIVMKYKFNPDGDDPISLWINPDLSLTEQTPDAITTNGTDLEEISEIILSQLTASNEPPNAQIDGIKIKTNWEDVTVSIANSKKVYLNTFALSQNYPNPFNPATKISYKIPNPEFVTLKIYDTMGKEVLTLVNGYQLANTYTVTFDARLLSSGYYFYELKAGDYTNCRRMLLLK